MSIVPTATERSPWAARLFVLHHGIPDSVGIQIVTSVVEEGIGRLCVPKT